MSLLSAVLQEAEKATAEEFKQQRKDIYPKLLDLTERVQMLSWSLQQNLVDLYVNFCSTTSLELLNYKKRKASILSDYETLTEEFKQFQEKTECIDVDFHNGWLKLNKSYLFLKDLCVVAEGKRRLITADHEFRRYHYSEAILEVESLRKELKKLQFEGDLVTVLKNLQSGAENQLSLYVAQLSIEWEDLFSWSELKSLYHLTYSISVQQSAIYLLKNILKALYVAQRLNDELAVFSDYFTHKLLHNLIRHNCEIFTDEKLGAIIFNIKIDLTIDTKPSFHTIINNLTAVFEFLQSTLDANIDNDVKFIAILAESIRTEFFNKIIKDCIKNVLPTCETTYENYKSLVAELDAFNKFLIELKFVQADESPLNDYLHTECVLYKTKYDKLLADIRIIMKESLSYGTIVVGISDKEKQTLNFLDKEPWDLISKPLFLPKCVISQNVKKILSMIIEHLEDSVKYPERFSNQLVLYVKDIAMMYQWIVPKQFQVNLENCPFDIALFFNNCFYLAHGLLGPSWRNNLPLQLADNLNTVLIECVHDLRVLGLEKIMLYLEKQKTAINDNIGPKEPTNWTYEYYKQFNSAVAEALAIMKDLKSSWLNILPTSMYEMCMATLIQALCQCIIEKILCDTRFVGEDIILQIRRTFDNAIKDIGLLFEVQIEMEKQVRVWCKFVKMSQLMRAQLMEICELWNVGKELCVVFTCEEVRKVIKMRFPDDEVRLKILAEIQ